MFNEQQEKETIRHVETIAEWLGVDFAEALGLWREERRIGYKAFIAKYKRRAKNDRQPLIYWSTGAAESWDR